MLERVALRETGRHLRALVLEDCSINDDDVAVLAAALCRQGAQVEVEVAVACERCLDARACVALGVAIPRRRAC